MRDVAPEGRPLTGVVFYLALYKYRLTEPLVEIMPPKAALRPKAVLILT